MSTPEAAYAAAMTELAVEQNCAYEVYEACLTLKHALRKNPDYNEMLASSGISADTKKTLLSKWTSNAPKLFKDTIDLICDSRQAALIPKVIEAYLAEYRKQNSILPVKAISAVPLSPELAEELRLVLERRTGKAIILENQVEPSCIGGLKLEMDGKQYDGSLQARFENIRQTMNEPWKLDG